MERKHFRTGGGAQCRDLHHVGPSNGERPCKGVNGKWCMVRSVVPVDSSGKYIGWER